MAGVPQLHTIPIASRPPTWRTRPRQLVVGLVCAVFFNIGCLMINGSQLVFLVLLVPLRAACWLVGSDLGSEAHNEMVRWSKGTFAALLIAVTQLFAPTKFIISLEGADLRPDSVLVANDAGELVALNLPKHLVIMSNHQVYCDWLYLWCLTYFIDIHTDMYIMLKKSLKWAPIVGWGMQVFGFLFVARSWAADKAYLARNFVRIGRRRERKDEPLTMLIFPEGTLVSKDTRPLSKKFADKIGIDDMQYTLLPRATGMQYALRALAPHVKELYLLDATIVYPGIPPMGYGQSYYTLRSILFEGLSPPALHIALRLYRVRDEVPIGTIEVDGNGKELDVSDADRTVFEEWIRARWREKEARFERFYATGSLADSDSHVIHTDKDGASTGDAPASAREIELPVRLRSHWELLDAVGLPGPLGWRFLRGK